MKLLRSYSPIFPCGRNKGSLSNGKEAKGKGEQEGKKRLMCNAEDRNKAPGRLVSVLPLVLEPKPEVGDQVPGQSMSLRVDSAP